jgi:hypothetical protein
VDSAEDPIQRQEIQSSLKSIVETSDKWLGRLRRRESRVRLAISFLTMVLVFVAVGGGFLGVVIEFGLLGGLSNFLHQQSLDITVASTILLVGVISGFVTYFLLKRRHDAELKDLSSLITEMKKTNGGGGVGITEDALSLADKVFTLLPELVRKRGQDSLLFGIAAFIIAEIFGGNLAVAILVGAIVWIYFRWETRKTYGEEIAKFEEQKKVFEQRKKDFIETL